MKPFVGILITFAVLFFLTMEFLSRPAEQRRAPIVNAYESRARGQVPKEVVTRLSFEELTSNPLRYAGKRVTVNEGLMLSVRSWYERVCENWPIDAPGPCVPLGGPRNARCEYIAQLHGFSAYSNVIEGCVPRSKIWSIAGAWNGEQGVRFIGVVNPDPNEYRSAGGSQIKGWAFMYDMQIIQPRENTDETWPALRNKR